MYSPKVRKSFGFGLGITGLVGFMAQSNILMGGSDVRLSLLEGFRAPDWPGFLPDVAVGGGVRTITGTGAFQLTVASLDTQISKPIPVSNFSIITPWVGYQYVWIFGDSGLVDLTPRPIRWGTATTRATTFRAMGQRQDLHQRGPRW